MRTALVVGINYYEHGPALYGCVDDAHAVKAALERNGDGSVNFEVTCLTGTGPNDRVTRSDLKANVSKLFAADVDTALLYFAGHGHIESTGGYILATDSRRGDEGLPLSDIVVLANKSKIRNRIIVLDSCHSGIAADRVSNPGTAELTEGLTVLTASTADQYASESGTGGVFTTLLIDALNGAAANLLGHISPGSVYAHIDQTLGFIEQRPVFKTNVKNFVSLRNVQPPIPLSDLHQLPALFPKPGARFLLDPTYEPERSLSDTTLPPPDLLNTTVFATLQRLNRVNLVVPVDAPHMWHAAMQSKSCRLTVLGEHYRRLVELKRI